MTVTAEQIVLVGVPLVLGLVWLIRIEGRVNLGDARYGDITSRLIRIENKLDRNGYHADE